MCVSCMCVCDVCDVCVMCVCCVCAMCVSCVKQASSNPSFCSPPKISPSNQFVCVEFRIGGRETLCTHTYECEGKRMGVCRAPRHVRL